MTDQARTALDPVKDPERPLGEAGPLGTAAATPAPASPAPPAPREVGLATITVVTGFAFLIACLVVLGSIAEGVRSQEVFALDTWATPFLHGISSPGLDTFMNDVTDLGSILVLPLIFVVVEAWLLWRRRYRAGGFLLVASLGSLVIQGTMKLFFARPRPQLPYAHVLPDYSFPSGHTMNAVIVYGALALILWSVFGRRAGLVSIVIAIVLAIGVGISRIYLGYHYLTDVVGGILAGLAWLVVVGAAFRARPTWQRWRTAARPRETGGTGPGPATAQ
jgi:membrane-associated phospholipid phosphatase